MARYIGRRGRVLVNSTAITARKWTLNSSRADIDMTMFGDVNKVTFKDLPEFKGTFEGVFENTETTVFAATEGDVAVPCALYPDFTNIPGKFWCGLGFVDYNIDTDVAGRVTVAGTWVAGGAWVRQ